MDDLWEVKNKLDPITDDSLLDFDSDGLNNIGEYKAGTDATDPGSNVSVRMITPIQVLFSNKGKVKGGPGSGPFTDHNKDGWDTDTCFLPVRKGRFVMTIQRIERGH